MAAGGTALQNPAAARPTSTTITPFLLRQRVLRIDYECGPVCPGLLCRIFISVQAAVNSQLAGALHANSVVAALISFSVGTVVLGIAAFARGGVGESLALLGQQPLWKLTGGMLGAAFVFGTVFLAPRIGLLNLVVLVIAGQLIMSMAIDNFGLVQMAVRKVSQHPHGRRPGRRGRRGIDLVRRPDCCCIGTLKNFSLAAAISDGHGSIMIGIV